MNSLLIWRQKKEGRRVGREINFTNSIIGRK
jgi:hypothetical protein